MRVIKIKALSLLIPSPQPSPGGRWGGLQEPLLHVTFWAPLFIGCPIASQQPLCIKAITTSVCNPRQSAAIFLFVNACTQCTVSMQDFYLHALAVVSLDYVAYRFRISLQFNLLHSLMEKSWSGFRYFLDNI